MTLAVIILIAALSFFPSLTLGPIAEQLQYFFQITEHFLTLKK